MHCPYDGKMFIWKSNDDGVNGSCVCVSRSFWGATKFPEKSDITSKDKHYHIWALDCKALRGYDLEEYQLSIYRPWRGGETLSPGAEHPHSKIALRPRRHPKPPEKASRIRIQSVAAWPDYT